MIAVAIAHASVCVAVLPVRTGRAGGIRSSLNGRERQSNHTAASRGDLGHLGRVAPESALGPCVMERIRDLTHRYDISREAGREDDKPFILVA